MRETSSKCIRTKSVGFHPRRRIDRVAKEAVARHLETHDAGHHWARMQSDAQFQLVVGPVSYAKVADGLQESQRHAGDLAGMQIPVPDGQPGDYHVSVADRLHLQNRPHKINYLIPHDCIACVAITLYTSKFSMMESKQV